MWQCCIVHLNVTRGPGPCPKSQRLMSRRGSSPCPSPLRAPLHARSLGATLMVHTRHAAACCDVRLVQISKRLPPVIKLQPPPHLTVAPPLTLDFGPYVLDLDSASTPSSAATVYCLEAIVQHRGADNTGKAHAPTRDGTLIPTGASEGIAASGMKPTTTPSPSSSRTLKG